MRFSVTYDVRGTPELPLDYRAGFVALIKTAFDKVNYERLQQEVHESLPLCFAIRFDRKPDIKGKAMIIGRSLRLYVSSSSLIFGTTIYNGLLSIKEFPIYNTKITNPLASYVKEYIIRHNIVTFVTLSPVVIRHYQRKDRYVLPNEEGFTESLLNAFSEQWRLYNTSSLDFHEAVNVELLKFKKVVMTHYGGLVLGFTGVLQMHAEPEILRFFYQLGIGYRRSNGFGFVEVDLQ